MRSADANDMEEAQRAHELAIRCLATLLRILGEQSSAIEGQDAPTLAARYEGWARHILFLSPPPDLEADRLQSSPQPCYRELETFVFQQQHRQSIYVNRSFEDLRTGLLVFAASIGELATEGRDADALALAQLDQMLGALRTASLEDLRHTVLSTTHALREILEERQQHLVHLVRALSEQANRLTGDDQGGVPSSPPDPVTRLDSRHTFEHRLFQASSLARMRDEPWCLLLVELDRAPSLREDLGQEGFHELLRLFSRLAAQTFPRRSDLVARYGEATVAVLLQNATDEDGLRMATRLQQAVRAQALEWQGQRLHVSVAAGVGTLSALESAQRSLARVEAALIQARAAGGNCVILAGAAPGVR